MVRKKTTASQRARRRRHLYLLPFLALFIVAIVVSGTYILAPKITKEQSENKGFSDSQLPPKTNTEAENTTTMASPSQSKPDNHVTPPQIRSQQENIDPNSSNNNLTMDESQNRDTISASALEITPPYSLDIQEPSPAQCKPSAQVITDFYSHLDKQEYFQDFGLVNRSEPHFRELILKLLNNPPIVSRETDDLFNILQNTAHFFRIIGKKNITILKGILDREKPAFEKVLEHFYRVATIPGCSKEQLTLPIHQDALYEYAGFFLNTMGGRLYLFRRDSISRMTVNFYAILIIDHANREENNKYGIQLKAPINSLINEIEATNDQLKMKDSYLDVLYDLKEKYE